MKLLITGARGTVGQAFVAEAATAGIKPIAWDRASAPPDQPEAGRALIDHHQPDALVCLAVPSTSTGRPDEGRLINVEWPAFLASESRKRSIPMIYTSTVMVFSDHARGPFRPETPPDATTGYGGEKRRGEEAVLQAYPGAIIARLGWQIGETFTGNTMTAHLAGQMARDGVISASRRWLPATSMLTDTARALLSLTRGAESGIYHLSANDRWNFFEIAVALNRRHGDRWNVTPNDDFIYDQRMLDEKIALPPLAKHLPELIADNA
ncbi:MAG TPA: sugar nucleotide-binding protein [Kiritimatiellia bacterium]|nr:sugar nucleotide-binding protein [Kiritimatiellia bacterium]HMO99523.1 sugar nucleotide-binding protein [Kiritimatiellia bacterium]HMP97164.1 sugar nucleotide-binding protein [Kiritimatiellia bacterium]